MTHTDSNRNDISQNRISVALLIVFSTLFSAWWATGSTWDFVGSKSEIRLLEMQVEAFSAGQLNLLVDPDPRLLALDNPYDPAANRGYRLLDATLYKNQYFTYFAPAPLVVFMWPVYAITGDHLPAALLATILGMMTCVFQGMAVLEMARAWFPNVSQSQIRVLMILGPSCVLLAPLLVSHETFDIPVLSALGFTSASLYFVVRAAAAAGANLQNWILASLFAGLACASRSLFIPVQAILLGGAFFLVSAGRFNIRKLAPAFLPFTSILLGLGLYNYLRFDNPINFGNTYTLVELDWSKTRAFSSSYLPVNFYLYFLSAPRLSDTFPFFIQSAALPETLPQGYLSSYVDRVAGVAVFYPIFLAPILGLFLWRRLPSPARSVFLVTLTGFACTCVVVLCFVGSSARYQAEMLTVALPPTLITLFALSTSAKGWWRGVLVYATITALSVTVLANMAVAWVGERGLGARNGDALKPLRSASDNAVLMFKNVMGMEPQYAVLTVILPADKNGRSEPLWVEGRPGEANFLYVYYSSPTTIQFGFEVMGRGGPLSAQIPVDYTQKHRIKIISGRFLPPAGHPYFSSINLPEGAPPQEMLQVLLDGTPVFAAQLKYHDGRREYFFGESPYEAAFGSLFTGQMTVTWEDFSPDDYRRWADVLNTPTRTP